MIKKALHRITVLWCLYGLVRLCMFVHPHMILLFAKVDPTFTPGHPDYGIGEQGVVMWLVTIFALLIIFLIGFTIHHFANWFFNAKN